MFAINTVCNYDPDIIPYLHSEIGSTLIRINSNSYDYDEEKGIGLEKKSKLDDNTVIKIKNLEKIHILFNFIYKNKLI